MKEQRQDQIRGRHDGLSLLKKYSHLPAERIQYYAEADLSALQNIQRGVFFVIAFWSGPAVRAFIDLAEVLRRLDSEGELELIVVDTDGTGKLADTPEINRRLHGWGETFWVRKGVIQYFVGKERTPEQILIWTKALLEMP